MSTGWGMKATGRGISSTGWGEISTGWLVECYRAISKYDYRPINAYKWYQKTFHLVNIGQGTIKFN